MKGAKMSLKNEFLLIFYYGKSKNYTATAISIVTIDENINGNLNVYNNLNIYINYTINIENEFLFILVPICKKYVNKHILV
jgi:hypothetical protein